MDKVDKATRSRIMARVKCKNTLPELIVRKGLFSRGFRFRLHSSSLPGKPDLVLPKYRTTVFVHGCFWHGHNCSRFRLPASNVDYWSAKIERNRVNDAKKKAALEALGYRVLIIWECSISGKRGDVEEMLDRTAARLLDVPHDLDS